MPSNKHQTIAIFRAVGLRKAFGGQIVLDDLDLELWPGDIVLLRGDNGSGKTTLLNILTGNIKPDAGKIEVGTESPEMFHFPRPFWVALNPKKGFTPERLACKGVGRTWQESRLFTSQRVFDNIAVASPDRISENPMISLLRRSKMNTEERLNRIASLKILEQLRLSDIADAPAGNVSVGQAKRVAMARALRAGARVLFLDEPLAGLDAAGVSKTLELLKTLARDGKITLVIVEHLFNIPHILGFATKVWTLNNGKLQVETPANVRSEIILQLEGGAHNIISKFSGDGELFSEPLGGGALLTKINITKPDVATAVLEVENLVVYRGNHLIIGRKGINGAIRGLSFRIAQGELALLRAPNGWGKTTLIEAIMGIVPIAQGSIKFRGKSIELSEPWERARMGLAFLQLQRNDFPSLKVRESLRLASIDPIPNDLIPLLDRRSADLSGGEKQKVAIACMAKEHHFGFYDEPFSGLDATRIVGFWSKLIKPASYIASLIALPSCLDINNNCYTQLYEK